MDDLYGTLDRLYQDDGGEAVERFLRAEIAALHTSGREDSREYMLCVSELAGYLRGVGRYDESIAAYLEACEFIARTDGQAGADYATTLNNLAGAYRMKGDTDESLRLFLKSMEIYDSHPDRDPYLYAGVLNNIAILHRVRGDLDKAIDFQRRGVAMLEEAGTYVDELATSLSNLASLYGQIGDIPSAERENDRAISLFESLPYESVHYAAALNNRASFLVRRGSQGEALAILEDVAEKIKAVFGENADYRTVCGNIEALRERMAPKEAQ
jgi:tetratricopeptide (TPR) repeat protein